jgi:hypothetical protein
MFLRGHSGAHIRFNLGAGRPDVLQVYDPAIAAPAEAKAVFGDARLELAAGVKRMRTAHHPVHIAGKGHGDNERRRGQEIGIHGLVHTAP